MAVWKRLTEVLKRGRTKRPKTSNRSGLFDAVSARQPIPHSRIVRVRDLLAALPRLFHLAGAAVITGLFIWVFCQFLFTSQFFHATEWNIVGLDRLSEQEVIHLVSGDPEEPLHTIRLDKDQRERELAKHPVIHHAHIWITWPRRVNVIVEERDEVALLVSDRESYLVDCEGVLFAIAEGEDLLDSALPILTGPARQSYHLGEALPQDFFDLAYLYLLTIQEAGGPLAGRLSEVHWQPGQGISLFLDRGARLVCGTHAPSQTLPKAIALHQKLGSLDSVDYADLRLGSHLPWHPHLAVPDNQIAQR